MIPDRMHGAFLIGAFAGDHHHGILVREYHAVLTIGAVCPEAAGRIQPELETIPITPGTIVLTSVDLLSCREPHPLPADELAVLPSALLQIELAQLPDVFGADTKVGGAHIDTFAVFGPGGAGNPQRVVEPGFEVGMDVVTRH